MVAALFAREGADVAIVYLSEHRDDKDTVAIVEKEIRKALALSGDVGDKAFCDSAVAQTIEAFGKLDILMNNAGEQHPDKDNRHHGGAASQDFPDEHLRHVLHGVGRSSASPQRIRDHQLHLRDQLPGMVRAA